MSQHKATFTSIDDENGICPICGVTIFDMDSEEDWAPPADCPHLVCCLPWEAEEFETAHPAVAQWWEARKQAAKEADEYLKISELVHCPVIDHLIEHSVNGIACGPVCSTASFGFATNPP